MVIDVKVAEKHLPALPLSLYILDPDLVELQKQMHVAACKLSIVSTRKGAYQLCLINSEKYYLHTFIQVQSGPAAKDYTSLLSTEDVKPVERQLARIRETAGLIQQELKALSRVEEGLRKGTHKVYSRVIGTGLVTLAVIGVVGVVQVWGMRRVLKAKKAI